MSTTLLSAVAIAIASAAQAQSFEPAIPTPVNPAPANAISTNGAVLPQYAVPAAPRFSGRSVAIDRSERF